MSAPGMSLSERLGSIYWLLRTSDHHDEADVVQQAADVLSRLTVDGLAGVTDTAMDLWWADFAAARVDGGEASRYIAQAIIDHLMQSQDPLEAVSSPPLDGVGGNASRAQEQPSQSGPGAVAPATFGQVKP